MKSIVKFLFFFLAGLAVFAGCGKENKEHEEQTKNESVEKQWFGTFVEDGKKINVCIDVGETIPGKIVLGMNLGQYGLTFPGAGKNDYIYTDDMIMAYQVTFSSHDSGIIAITDSDGGAQEIQFTNLTGKSVEITAEDETMTLTAGKTKLVRIGE